MNSSIVERDYEGQHKTLLSPIAGNYRVLELLHQKPGQRPNMYLLLYHSITGATPERPDLRVGKVSRSAAGAGKADAVWSSSLGLETQSWESLAYG